MGQHQVEWRRNKVFDLSTKGNSQADISKILNIPKSTISRDISFLRNNAQENLRHHIEKRLPYEYEQCVKGITQIINQAWTISENTDDHREKLQCLSLAKDCYSTKMDLLTNSELIKDALEFVNESKEELKNKSAKIDDFTSSKLENNKEDKIFDIQGSKEDNSITRSKEESFNRTF
ncbi:MAG: hypothetical protein ACPKPY_02165 [Nitrososphaeraceae archaeon]